MNSGTISGIVTVVFIAVFIGIVWWAYSKKNKHSFDEAARLPFDEDNDRQTSEMGDKK